MANHVTGTSVLLSVPPISLGELRQHVLAPLLGHPYFSDAEQLRANHFVHECEDIARLIRWGESVQAEIARREAAARAEAARQRCHHATQEVLRHLRASRFRGHYPPPPRPRPIWAPGAPLPAQADRRAGTFDRVAAACFQAVDSLMFASLLSQKSK